MEWFDELPLDPATHPVSMGTRSLGDRPWLIRDDRFDDEIAERRWSLEHRRDAVAWFTEESIDPARRLCELFEEAGVALTTSTGGPKLHPLEVAARSVQEDLCLLRRDESTGRWCFDASVVCFPTYWHLPSKIGKPIGAVHDPVGDYDLIAEKMTRLFDRVGERGVIRRNMNLADDRTLFQPRYRDGHPDVPADRVMTDLLVRTERQVLRKIAERWLVFTIKVQIASIGELLTTPDRVAHFRRWVADVSPELAPRRHLGEPQRTTLLRVLDS